MRFAPFICLKTQQYSLEQGTPTENIQKILDLLVGNGLSTVVCEEREPAKNKVRFQWKNPDFNGRILIFYCRILISDWKMADFIIKRNVDFIIKRNNDFIIKRNVDFIVKRNVFFIIKRNVDFIIKRNVDFMIKNTVPNPDLLSGILISYWKMLNI